MTKPPLPLYGAGGTHTYLQGGGVGGGKKVYIVCVPQFSKEATGSLNRGNRLATIGGERRMTNHDLNKRYADTLNFYNIKIKEYGLDHIEWGCEKHNMNKIWIDESHAICLQCAVEDLGFKVVSDWLKEIKHIR